MARLNSRPAAKRAQGYILAMLALAAVVPSFAQVAKPTGNDRVRRVVVVSIPDRKLAVLEGDTVIASFPIAVGAPSSPSPTGEFQIVSRVANPTYYRPGTVIPSGKDNPVGTRWIGLSQKGYGIHGTNAPKSVGHAASHGCIRLRNRDVEQLFSMLQVGDVVQIRAERDDEIAQIFDGEEEEAEATTGQTTGLE
jgi:lipoprotein-anchoring transpeptidase ErfK/SrfK